jgi:hypothetical protein
LQVYDALSANNENTGGSYIDKGPNIYFIRGEGLISSLHDIGLYHYKTKWDAGVCKDGQSAIWLCSALWCDDRNGQGKQLADLC